MTSADTTLVDGLRLLGELPGMTREQFADSKEDVERTLVGPARELVEEVGAALREQVSPTIEAVPKINGSISPLHRDLRFATDRSTLYKDHLLLNFWDGTPRRHAPTLRIRIAPDGVGFAAGVAFDARGLTAWRRALCSPAATELQRIVESLSEGWELRRNEAELARVPTALDPVGELARELCRHRTIQYRAVEPAPGPAWSGGWFAERLVRFGDLHRWLLGVCR